MYADCEETAMKITEYTLPAPLKKTCRAALLSDLHTKIPEGLLETIASHKPDIITIAGDLIDCRTETEDHALCSAEGFEAMLHFLKNLAALAPVFYAGGNHDILSKEQKARIARTGVRFLDNESACFGDLTIGGLSSGYGNKIQSRWAKTPPPDLSFLDRFEKLGGCKLLLSHHPEYYPCYLRERDIDFIFSGHAHGGQWRFFGRGVFAPGQGLFPRYTAGVHEKRLVISRGLGNHTIIPRLFNPLELIFVTLTPR